MFIGIQLYHIVPLGQGGRVVIIPTVPEPVLTPIPLYHWNKVDTGIRWTGSTLERLVRITAPRSPSGTMVWDVHS